MLSKVELVNRQQKKGESDANATFEGQMRKPRFKLRGLSICELEQGCKQSVCTSVVVPTTQMFFGSECARAEGKRKQEALNSAAVKKGFPFLNTSIGVVVEVEAQSLFSLFSPLHWHSISLVLRCRVHTNSR